MRDIRDYLKNERDFTPALFARGEAAFSVVLTWQWLSLPEEETIRTQLDAVKAAGFETVYILPMPEEFRPTSMITELRGYLGREYMDRVRAAVTYARGIGLGCWLYDEGGWPSGGACGRVAAQAPHLRRKRLDRRDRRLAAGETYTPPADVLGAFCGKTKLTGPHTAAGDETVTEYRVAVSGGIGADLYEAETVRRFTALTHDAYAEALGPEITRIPAMFTDEPAGAPDAVTEEILRTFAERCGCRLEDRLYVLSDRADLSPEETRLRLAYFRLLEELFARALRGMREACRAHGMLLTGHLDRDHLPDACYSLGYGNALAMLRILDVPGVDAILGQLLPEGSLLPEGMGFYPRMASSAAAQNGTRLALSESFGVYGNALSGDALRWLVSSQLVRGIDLFNAMLCPSTVEKWYAYGERQFFHPSFPGFNAMDGLWREIGRACLFMGTGDHAADTALFYPCADLLLEPARRSAAGERFCAAGDELEAAGIDFDVIDEEAILAGDLRDGALCCGTARYTKIVVPEGASLSPEAAEKLGALSGKCEPLVAGLPENVLHRAVRDNGGDLHVCVSNLRRETVEARVCLRTDAPVYRADARTGAFTAFENGGAVALRPGETALFYATRRAVPAAAPRVEGAPVPLTPAGAEKTAEFRLEKTGAVLDGTRAPAAFRTEFCELFGAGFAGEVTYRFAFSLDGPAALRLKLADLRHFAEVFLNGARVGSLCVSPFALDLPAERTRAGENELVLKVSNLTGPVYARTDPARWFAPEQIGPYHAPSLGFEKKVPEGGFRDAALFRLA